MWEVQMVRPAMSRPDTDDICSVLCFPLALSECSRLHNPRATLRPLPSQGVSIVVIPVLY